MDEPVSERLNPHDRTFIAATLGTLIRARPVAAMQMADRLIASGREQQPVGDPVRRDPVLLQTTRKKTSCNWHWL
jgi:hypothetical protein